MLVAPVVSCVAVSAGRNCGSRCAFWWSKLLVVLCFLVVQIVLSGPHYTYWKLIRYQPLLSKMPGPFSGIFLVVYFYHTTCTDWALAYFRGCRSKLWQSSNHRHHNVAIVCVTLQRSAPASATGSQPWSGHQLPGEGTHGLELRCVKD